ncbi:MAG TPA: MraY family glycosyltransferase [Candidatus Gracilibacteria bacterium]|nr:MraY family glycosyltransferase [Candidatus Gracilibacteria bacterium]
MDKYLVVALVSFLLSFVGVLFAMKIFPKLNLMDRPAKYGLNRAPIPYYGGIVIFLAFLISVIVFVPLSEHVLWLLGVASVIAIVGFLDDYFSLPPIVRLVVQIVCGVVIAMAGVYVLSISSPFGGSLKLDSYFLYGIPVFGALFTVFWVVLITNSMNFLDGVGGLSSGVSSIAFFTLFALSIRPDLHTNVASQQIVATISLILALVTLAFTLFDFPKSKILMGDTGSTFLGFMIAALSLFSGGKIATAFIVLGIPILDAFWVIFRRIFEGKKPWHGDLKHLHHRLLSFGLKAPTVLIIIYTISIVFGALAVFATNSKQKFSVIIGLLVLMFVMAIVLIRGGKRKNALK